MKDEMIGKFAAASVLFTPVVIGPALIQGVMWCLGKPERPLSDIVHTFKTGYAPPVRS